MSHDWNNFQLNPPLTSYAVLNPSLTEVSRDVLNVFCVILIERSNQDSILVFGRDFRWFSCLFFMEVDDSI